MALSGPQFSGSGSWQAAGERVALVTCVPFGRCDLVDDIRYSADWMASPVLLLLESLLRIPVKLAEDGDLVDGLVASAAMQNQNAQVTPLSAVQWAQLLVKIDETSFDLAFARYNDHPLVQSYKSQKDGEAGSDSDDDGGRGMAMGASKKVLVKNLMQMCDKQVFRIILDHLDDHQWKFSVFTEKILRLPVLWMQSVQDIACVGSEAAPTVGPNESSVEMRSRPLSKAGQVRLFGRIVQDFSSF